MGRTLYVLNLIRFIPLFLVFYTSRFKEELILERNVWIDVIKKDGSYTFRSFLWLLIKLPEYRTVLYYRLGPRKRLILNFFAKEQGLCFLNMPSSKIGLGLVLQHGYSVIVGAIRIGKNCQIWHNVTIGTNKSGSGNKAIIGDNVKICTGAIVLGSVNIGDNVIIGAGAVVVKDIPANSIVVGNPAHIIYKDGQKCFIKL